MPSVDDIGIDMGTSRVLITMRGRGLILNEPNVAIVDRETRSIFSYGDEADKSLGRLPQNLIAVHPLKDGVVSDHELVVFLLQSFVKKAIGKHFFRHPKAVLSLPTGVNDMEKHNLSTCLLNAGLRRTSTLNRSLAAIIGAGIRPEEPYATLIVDVSAGVTDIAVVSSGRIVVSDCVNVGGNRIDDSITYYLRKKYNLLIGEKTAEEVKINIGSALSRAEPQYMDITGRNLLSGLPKTMRITSTDITEAIEEPIVHLIQSIHSVLEHTPDEMAADIAKYGILFSGGGSQLYGLCEAIRQAISVPCMVAENPAENVVEGCGILVDNIGEMGRYLDRYKIR